jgi:hypothetical protein
MRSNAKPPKPPPPTLTRPPEIERLADLAMIDDDGREAFFDDLMEVFIDYFEGRSAVDRNRHREAAPALRQLLAATQTLRKLLDRVDTAAGLLYESHVDTRDREHGRWLELLEQACRDNLERARLGGRPTKWAPKLAVILLARLQATHCVLLAHRDPDSFTNEDGTDRRVVFATELKRTRVPFIQAALDRISVEMKRPAIRDVIALGLRERSLQTPESLYDDRAAFSIAYEAGRRTRRTNAEIRRALLTVLPSLQPVPRRGKT